MTHRLERRQFDAMGTACEVAGYARPPERAHALPALAAGRPALLNIRVQSQISMRAQGIVDSRKKGGAF